MRYLIRALDLPQMQILLERVKKIAEGAALMTETSVKSDIVSGDANLIGNPTLEQLMQRELDRLGPPVLMSRTAKLHNSFRQLYQKKIFPMRSAVLVLSQRQNLRFAKASMRLIRAITHSSARRMWAV